MARVLEVKDRSGKLVYLTDERYKHILKHPEMQNSLQLIEQTVKNPDKMAQYSIDPAIRLYYTHHKNRKSKARYLRVAVKYLNGEGFVITAYFVVNI
ncbi:MAG: hypothetical protein HY513_02870 [Candidatus Aenigmarchaeota archaeon]|nr:hypothetical protein [Candidatus Aenigmarchaeota archaeon]